MARGSGGFTSSHFSTEPLPPAQRMAMWHEALDRHLGGRRTIAPLPEQPVQVEMKVCRLGYVEERPDAHADASVVRMAATVCGTVRRIPALLHDGDDDVLLHIHEAGRRTVSQLGREATAEPGGGVFVSNAEICTHFLPTPSRFAIVRVPIKPLMALAPRVEDAFARSLPPDAGVLRLLMKYLDVLDDARALSTLELQRAIATHIYDLCALAIGATRDAVELAKGRGLRAARMRTIKADIARNLETGDVSAAALARSQRISPRYIQKLFEGEGTTLSRFVLNQRLARVHRMLADPLQADLTISAIAYRTGFGDLSTFNREFRRRFGATPSDVRARARRRQ